jgi:outer membrane protein assembly factor BamB
MKTRTGIAGWAGHVLLACLFAALASCGGGDSNGTNPDNGGNTGGTPTTPGSGGSGTGGGTGGTPTGQPEIYATVGLFAPFAGQPASAQGFVGVLSQAGAPVTDAVVKINGTTLPYVPTEEGYLADLDVQPGRQVNLSATIGGVEYTASATFASLYPVITSPANGASWTTDGVNLVQWSDASTNPGRYLLALVGRTYDWPTNTWLSLAGSRSSYEIAAGTLQPDNYLVILGRSQDSAIPGAQQDSLLNLAMFTLSAVQVSTPATPDAPIREIIIDTQALGPIALIVGKSRQLTATAWYTNFTDRDITSVGTWTSSNSAAISVSRQGLLTANGVGTAQITMSFGGSSASITVHAFQPAPYAAGPLGNAVSVQMDAAHSGRASLGAANLALPLAGRWTTTLNGAVSHPVVAGGKVFVTTAYSAGQHPAGYGSSLYALDVGSGAVLWGPVDVPGTYNLSSLTYDNGKLFVVNFDNLLRAFDPDTGALLWSQQVFGGFVNSSPVAAHGILYITSSGYVSAVEQAHGGLLWARMIDGGGRATPAVTADGVFVSGPCRVYKLDPFTGAEMWKYSGPCSGAGGRTSAYADGKLYVRDNFNSFPVVNAPNAIFDAATGSVIGTFAGRDIPAPGSDRLYFLQNGTLQASSFAPGASGWSFAGDQGLVAPPIVVGDAVVTASTSGTVYMLDRATGSQLWTGQAAAGIEAWNENQNAPLATLGIGGGYLIVPAGRTLTGWKLTP